MNTKWIKDRAETMDLPDSVIADIQNGNYTPVCAKVSPGGSVTYTKLNADGYFLRGNKGKIPELDGY